MSPRVTRSATKLAEGPSSAAAIQSTLSGPTSNSAPAPPVAKPRKRKAPDRAASPDSTSNTTQAPPAKRARKQKLTAAEASTPITPKPSSAGLKPSTIMGKSGSSSGTAGSKEKSPPDTSDTSRRKSSRGKKPGPGPDAESSSMPSASTNTKRHKKLVAKKSDDVVMRETEEMPKKTSKDTAEASGDGYPSESDDALARRRYEDDEDDGDDPFRGGYLGASGPNASMSSTLRALSGYMSGVSQRLRDILNNLRQKDDPSVQLIALQELSEILLVSNEDNLSGHFSPDQFVKELVILMQPNDFGEENPEMMLLACRCIANLMEALPQTSANVVYGGAVPILCQKLMEISFIDLAEQALSTLEKVSTEFPSVIVREGGLTACLTYLDWFATSTQRTAVTTAANCCKNIPSESFPVIRDAMPILLGVLSSSDQKVVEQGSICVSRIVESFKYQHDKLEELVSPDLLKAIRRLLQPGTTNLIGPSIHTQFLHVLSITARASPRLSAELFKMGIVDTLYQILTGVSPPDDLEDVSSQIDSVFIMQALIHRPREQISETLNVICELLPAVKDENLCYKEDLYNASFSADGPRHMTVSLEATHNNARVESLQGCEEELKRFAFVLIPTLTDAYSSTVNLVVRQKVLLAQLKMLSNLSPLVLKDALHTVPYASYLASILSQEDHPYLVAYALKAADLLLDRLQSIYGYQFYREGVMAEVSRIANKSISKVEMTPKAIKTEPDPEPQQSKPGEPTENDGLSRPSDRLEVEEVSEADSDHDDDHNDDEDDGNADEEDGGPHEIQEDISPSPTDSSSSSHDYPTATHITDQDLNVLYARKFLETHETTKANTVRDKANVLLTDLQMLANSIETRYLSQGAGDGAALFMQLSEYFRGDAMETITSSELLHSEIVRVLLEVFSSTKGGVGAQARTDFLEVFMTAAASNSTGSNASSTPFSVFIHKLQNLLSRAEHFEVLTVNHSTSDNSRSSPSSMLAKQIRLKLVADDDADMPRSYRGLLISIHAIATFKALDDYLRPRISMSDRPPKGSRSRESVASAIAAFAAAAGIPHPHAQLVERSGAIPAASPSHSTPTQSSTNMRSDRKASKTKNVPSPSPSTPAKEKPTSSRRSSRRHQLANELSSDAPAPPPERVQTPLECADERQLSDEDDLDDESALDAIVDDLEDGMENEPLPDPSAVNLEIAATGKVTARKEDGTRVATPSQVPGPSNGSSKSRTRDISATGIHASPAGRALSYAAAIQAVPQDWHIEFSIDGHPIPNDTTIYRAVHQNNEISTDPSPRNVWSAVHTVKFARKSGPPPTDLSLQKAPTESTLNVQTSNLPSSLHGHPATSKILRLLNILHEMNANLDDVLDDSEASVHVKAEPASQFVNTKLTAKLNRQLEEPLIVASNCLPSWSEDLAHFYPFLFPFETRHLFLQSTSFGYARSMTRWQNQSAEENRRDRHRDDRPFMGRLQRQKVRISRTRMLESAMKVMELYGGSSSVLEVEYFEEVGTGLGPTLEFYSTVSKEFSKKKTKLWRDNDANDSDDFAFSKQGLFPAPMDAGQAKTENGKRTIQMFRMLGKFIARSMLDSRIIDVSLNPTFFRLGAQPSTVPLSLGAVKTVDPQLASSLKLLKQYASAKKDLDRKSRSSTAQKATRAVIIKGSRIEDLGLDFTLPGYPAIELIPDGANISVTLENVALYVDKVIDMTLGSGVQRQVDQFMAGFSEVFPYSALKAFTPSELVMLFGRVEEDWSIETLLDSIKADHGYNMDSKSVRNLLQVMSELSAPQRRDFLQFVTGSPKLPIGGFKSLNPMFTVVCKPSEPPYESDDFLVSVMTCANYVKLPNYTDIDVLRKRLLTAIQEGQGAFHLS